MTGIASTNPAIARSGSTLPRPTSVTQTRRRYTNAQTEQRSSFTPPVDRVRLEVLRYAANEESAQYIAVMRTFTGGLSGLLSDRSAADVAARLSEEGFELDTDTTETRLSYLVEHRNLARSPRETRGQERA